MSDAQMPAFTGDDIPRQQREWQAKNQTTQVPAPQTPAAPTSPFDGAGGGNWNTAPYIPSPTIPNPSNDIYPVKPAQPIQPQTVNYQTNSAGQLPWAQTWDDDPLRKLLLTRAWNSSY